MAKMNQTVNSKPLIKEETREKNEEQRNIADLVVFRLQWSAFPFKIAAGFISKRPIYLSSMSVWIVLKLRKGFYYLVDGAARNIAAFGRVYAD